MEGTQVSNICLEVMLQVDLRLPFEFLEGTWKLIIKS